MKYLKFFEDYIKHSDPLVINHTLRDFSRKLEDIVIALQESNKLKNTTVKRHFHKNETITIVYENSYNTKFLKLELKNDEKRVGLSIKVYRIGPVLGNRNLTDKNSLKFFNFVDSKLSEYKQHIEQYQEISDYLSIENSYIFPLTELDNVLDKLEEYYIYTDSDKYNL